MGAAEELALGLLNDLAEDGLQMDLTPGLQLSWGIQWYPQAYLDPNSTSHQGPNFVKGAQKAMCLHTFGVQVRVSSLELLLESRVWGCPGFGAV